MCGPIGTLRKLAFSKEHVCVGADPSTPLVSPALRTGSVFGLALSAFGIAFLSFLAILIRNDYP